MAIKKASKKAVKKTAPKTVKKSKIKTKPAVKAKPKKAAAPKITPAKSVKVAQPAAQKVQPSPAKVEVVELRENSFVIIIGRARNFFDREELKSLVRICHAAANENEAVTRLFVWLREKRKDALLDSGISSAGSEALHNVYKVLVSTYSVKGQ